MASDNKGGYGFAFAVDVEAQLGCFMVGRADCAQMAGTDTEGPCMLSFLPLMFILFLPATSQPDVRSRVARMVNILDTAKRPNTSTFLWPPLSRGRLWLASMSSASEVSSAAQVGGQRQSTGDFTH